MKRLASVALAALTAVSCKHIEYVEVPIVTHDTTVVYDVRRDSVRQYDSVYVMEKGDTVYLYKYKYIDRIRMQKDSIYVAKVDTITRVEVKEVEKRLTLAERVCLKIGSWLWWMLVLVAAVCLLWLCVKKMRRNL